MKTAILQFLLARGAGDAALRRFLALAKGHGPDFAQEMCRASRVLTTRLGLRPDVAENIVNLEGDAQRLAQELETAQIQWVWLGSDAYPTRLQAILQNDAPPVLFGRGNWTLLDRPGVGFCGSRKASDKGLNIAERCAKTLSDFKICVVSGYAHGVDMAAHKAALTGGGTTILVLAEGLLNFKKKAEIDQILTDSNYLAISQFSPKQSWLARNAMARNATIIGLSDAMILVESGLSGGTFAAGQETLRRKRPLFVVDYADPVPSAPANPFFIERGGQPIRGNRTGQPNLDALLTCVQHQSEPKTATEPSLFDPQPESAIR
ncbi:MAG: DNA-processing protein DprA [Acidobacteria bacterium]|nr:DNA-processing protein DprA [Acidobacteriota bacterium]